MKNKKTVAVMLIISVLVAALIYVIVFYKHSKESSIGSAKTKESPKSISSGMPGMEGMAPITEKGKPDDYIITVGQQRRQEFGIRTGPVIKGPMSLIIRAFGNITYNETDLADVTLRVSGWITKLNVNFRGEYVKKGDVLFTLYSPDLYSSQKEYLQVLKRFQSADESDPVASLIKAARQRLKLFGIADEQIDAISQSQEAFEQMPILAPADGYVIEKHVVIGDFFEAGQKIYRIAPINQVWLKSEIYQSDFLQLHTGARAKISLPYIPGKTFEGSISYVYPYLEGNARTGEVLIELDNPIEHFLPNMYANTEFEVALGERVQVPVSAVIYLGEHRLVFLDLGEGRLRPKKVMVGLQSKGYYEVISGLHVGDQVVTSGNFLIAAESKILSAIKYWEGTDESKQGK